MNSNLCRAKTCAWIIAQWFEVIVHKLWNRRQKRGEKTKRYVRSTLAIIDFAWLIALNLSQLFHAVNIKQSMKISDLSSAAHVFLTYKFNEKLQHPSFFALLLQTFDFKISYTSFWRKEEKTTHTKKLFKMVVKKELKQ